MSIVIDAVRRPIHRAAVGMWVCAQLVFAQPKESNGVENPPLLKVVRAARPQRNLLSVLPEGALPPSPEAVLDLNVEYTNGKLWNPAERRYDQVKLRSYQGTGVDSNSPYVSPTIETFPGETIRLTLNNRLPFEP